MQRWHVDQLTKNGVRGAWIFPGCNECDLVDMNSALTVPILGFGSDRLQALSQSFAWSYRCYSAEAEHPIDIDEAGNRSKLKRKSDDRQAVVELT